VRGYFADFRGFERQEMKRGRKLSTFLPSATWEREAKTNVESGQAVFSGSLLVMGEPETLRAAGLDARTGVKLPVFQDCDGLAMLSPANLPPGVRG